MLSQQNKIAKSNLDALTKDEKSLKEAAAKKAIESGTAALTKKVVGTVTSKALGGIVGDIVVNPPAMPANKDCVPGAKPPYCMVSAKPITTPAAVKSQAPVAKSTPVATKPTSAAAAKPSTSTTTVMAALAKATPAAAKPQAPAAKVVTATAVKTVPATPKPQAPASKPQKPILTKKTIVPAKPALPPQKRVILKKHIVRAKPLQPAARNSKPAKSARHHTPSVSTESRYHAVTDSHGNTVTTSSGGIVVTDSSRDYYDNNRWSGHDCGSDSNRGYGTGGGFSGSGGDSPGYGGKGCK